MQDASNPQQTRSNPPSTRSDADLDEAFEELRASLQLLTSALLEADMELNNAAERVAGLYVAEYLRKF